jgi:signal transduction histidine kinase
MNDDIKISKNRSLKQLIQRQIGGRIVLAFGLLLVLLIFLGRSELNVWSEQVLREVKQSCQKLEDYTIGQMLVENEEAARSKIQQFNDDSPYIHLRWDRTSEATTDRELRWRFPFNWEFNYQLREIGGQKFGGYNVAGSILTDKQIFTELLMRILLIIIFSILIVAALLPLGKRIPDLLIFQPLNGVLNSLRNKSDVDSALDPEVEKTEEIQNIRNEILSLVKEAEDASRLKAYEQMASQVAHDIRSPLAALSTLENELCGLPEDTRILARKSIMRIRDIANNLLQKNSLGKGASGKAQIQKVEESTSLQPEHVPTLIESVISEVRQKYSSRRDLVIESDISVAAMCCFVSVCPGDFQRVLSNLLVNAVESIDKPGGVVKASVQTECSEFLTLTVSDNGSGIPEHILPTLGERGVTFKEGGSGYGLHYSKISVANWNGQLIIDSKTGVGTEIKIKLPLASKPEWFASVIEIGLSDSIVVLDDDESIHQVWEKRIGPVLKDRGTEIIHFNCADELKSWWQSHTKPNPNILFLVDFELNRQTQTGLDLIAELGIESKSILVTSRSEESSIRARCISLGLQILPKSLAPYVNIKNANKLTPPDLALIDDDELIRMTWKNRAADKSKTVALFENADDFLKADVSISTPIYIDFHLANGVSGIDVARSLKEIGYKNLYLATGESQIDMPPYIKSLRGKGFPLT